MAALAPESNRQPRLTRANVLTQTVLHLVEGIPVHDRHLHDLAELVAEGWLRNHHGPFSYETQNRARSLADFHERVNIERFRRSS